MLYHIQNIREQLIQHVLLILHITFKDDIYILKGIQYDMKL